MYQEGQSEVADWGTAVEADTRQKSQVGTELAEMPENLEHLGQAVKELESRLSVVLRERADSEKALSEPRPAYVAYAEQLNSHNGRLRYIRGQLVSILERLEL